MIKNEEIEEIKIRWKTEDPLHHEVVLKNDTYEMHVLGDHADKDKKQREAIEQKAKGTIENPRIVIKDKNHDERLNYIDLVIIPNEDEFKLRSLTVVVDRSKNPYEVVTWIPQRRLRETFSQEEVIYDEKDVNKSSQK